MEPDRLGNQQKAPQFCGAFLSISDDATAKRSIVFF
jgi:hypothetical protein